MSRRIVILSCEGATEELVVRHLVARQWLKDDFSSVGLHTIDLRGKLEAIGSWAAKYLDERSVLGVFTLIDLQGMDRVQHRPSDSLMPKCGGFAWLRARVNHKRRDDFFPPCGRAPN